MFNIKTYKEFLNESKSVSIGIDDVVSFFSKKLNIKDIFDVKKTMNINDLYANNSFNELLLSEKLKKSELQDNKTFEMLIDNNYNLTFFLLFNKNQLKIEEPIYIIMQYFNNTTHELSELYLFKNDNRINDFYGMLTDANIEIKDNGKTYLYSTTNAGNNWEMKNLKMVDKKHKKELDKDEINNQL